MDLQNQKETAQGNKKINELQKQHEKALNEYDNNSLGAETQKDFNKININQPNLLKITEARNENESLDVSKSKLEEVRVSK